MNSKTDHKAQNGIDETEPVDETVVIPAESMARFFSSFEKSTRRWEIVVYPAMFAFIILAIYGFILIRSLTSDMHLIAQSIDPDMGQHLGEMTTQITEMSVQIHAMRKDIQIMGHRMEALNHMGPMHGEIAQMSHSMKIITANTQAMQADMAALSYNLGRPMSTMNNWMPW